MKVVPWKWMLVTAVAVGLPCFVLAENPGSPKPPAATAAQSESSDPAIPAADKEPAEKGPPNRGPRQEMRRVREPKLEKAAFLGIVTRPVSEELHAQFKLPAGTALMVDRVEDDSPAAKAGIKKFDLLTKVDDQLIINPEQLAVLIRMHKANDEVKLGIIHEAAPATVSVTLIEKDLPPLDSARPPVPGGPKEFAGRDGQGPGRMGPMRGFMFGMRRGMGMRGRMGMGGGMGGMPDGMRRPWGMRGRMGARDGMRDGDGMRGEMGGRNGMRGGMGGRPGMPDGMDGRDGMRGGMSGSPGMRGGMDGRGAMPDERVGPPEMRGGMRGPWGMRNGTDGPDGTRNGMGGSPGMRGGMGGGPGMFGRWGMRGPQGESGMGRGPGAGPDDQNGPRDGVGRPDGPDDQGPPRGRSSRGRSRGPGAPATQPAAPAPGGQQP